MLDDTFKSLVEKDYKYNFDETEDDRRTVNEKEILRQEIALLTEEFLRNGGQITPVAINVRATNLTTNTVIHNKDGEAVFRKMNIFTLDQRKSQAFKEGKSTYIGNPCKKGHLLRSATSGHCVECDRISSKDFSKRKKKEREE